MTRAHLSLRDWAHAYWRASDKLGHWHGHVRERGVEGLALLATSRAAPACIVQRAADRLDALGVEPTNFPRSIA